jgi:anaerobic magnesium-protoporphyrin IX monomethyl ester cyclase
MRTAPEEILQGKWYHMPMLSLGYLAAVLERSAVETVIIDAHFERLGLAETVSRASKSSAGIFGITAMTHEIRRVHEVAKAIKEVVRGARVVVGGPHPTALPVRTMAEFPAFDYIVMAEGESTLVELIRALEHGSELDNVKGLVFRRNGEIVVNERRAWIDTLDSLPFPAWHLYPPAKAYPLLSARGCPFKCAFCMRVLGTKVRYRSAENVVDEMEYVANRFGARKFTIEDETFTVNFHRTQELADTIIRSGLHKRVKWNVTTRVDLADLDMFRRLKDAGCDLVGFGIESGSDLALQRVSKGVTTDQAEKAVLLARKAGLMTNAYYIFGHPHETRGDVLRTIDFATRLNTNKVVFGIMVPYPGTEIYQMAITGQGGYKIISSDWSDFDKHLGNALELENLDRKSLELLQMRAYLIFYIRNLRIVDLVKYAFEKRTAVLYQIKKLLFGKSTAAIAVSENKVERR